MMTLIKSPSGILFGLLFLMFPTTALLVYSGYVDMETVPLIAVVSMGVFFVLNLGVMFWPGVVKERQKGTSVLTIVMKLLLVVLFLSIPLLGGPGILLFFIIFLVSMMMPDSQSRFMKYQDTLPTSKVRSLAMGLVELEGKLVAQERVEAPLTRRRCIGYFYTEHRQTRDSDGKKSYRLVRQEQRCCDFFFEDTTGKVLVSGDDLDLHLLDINKEEFSGDRRYREYVLEGRGDYLLIGQATHRGNKTVIVRDKLRRVFGIAPLENLVRRSKLSVVLRSGGLYAVVTGLMIALVLTLPVQSWGQRLWIDYAAWAPYQLLTGIFQ